MSQFYSYSDLISRFQHAINELQKYDKLSDEQMSTKPHPNAWCAGEIFEHILMFNQIYLKMIEKGLDRAASTVSHSNKFQARLIMRPILSYVRPPYKTKIKTISPMMPSEKGDKDYQENLEGVVHTNRRCIEFIKRMEEKQLDLNRIKVKHSVFKIKMTLIEILLMVEAHQSRHVWQADQTLATLS